MYIHTYIFVRTCIYIYIYSSISQTINQMSSAEFSYSLLCTKFRPQALDKAWPWPRSVKHPRQKMAATFPK